MAKHTPGPWIYDGELVWAESLQGYVADPSTDDLTNGRLIGTTSCQEQIDANAALIAAAPDLYEACELAITTLIVSCRPAGNIDVDDAAEIRHAVKTLRYAISKVRQITDDLPPLVYSDMSG